MSLDKDAYKQQLLYIYLTDIRVVSVFSLNAWKECKYV